MPSGVGVGRVDLKVLYLKKLCSKDFWYLTGLNLFGHLERKFKEEH